MPFQSSFATPLFICVSKKREPSSVAHLYGCALSIECLNTFTPLMLTETSHHSLQEAELSLIAKHTQAIFAFSEEDFLNHSSYFSRADFHIVMLPDVDPHEETNISTHQFNLDHIWPLPDEEMHIFQREWVDCTQLNFTDTDGIIVSKADAIHPEMDLTHAGAIWVPGHETWKKLIAKKIWVNGSFDNEGEQSAVHPFFKDLTWHKLSHTDAPQLNQIKLISTYRLNKKSSFPDLSAKTHFFWKSGSLFRAALEEQPHIADKFHSCGAGHTYNELCKTLPRQQIKVFQDYHEWLKNMLNIPKETSPYTNLFKKSLQNLKREGRYRVFADLERCVGEAPYAIYRKDSTTKKVAVWCSNDYLGMSHHPSVIKAMHTELDVHGAGAGGTRNISGNHHTIVQLEAALADLQKKESALVFSSGYVANETALCTLASVLPNAVVFSDIANHASMIEGIRHSRAEKHIFRHNDVQHLEELLKSVPHGRPKIVAFESVYSMGGDFSPMKEMVALAKRYNALTYLDETHAVGLYGPRGGGLAEKLNMLDAFDCIQGGLGKGFGVVGGFVTGSKELIDIIRSYGAGFIFTTTIPPVVAAGALASIKHLKQSSAERTALFQNVAMVRTALRNAELPILETTSHIIPLMVGNSVLCKQVSDILLEQYDIYIQPINYPTVPRGTERLRITPSPYHTEAMLQKLVQALTEIWCTLELKLVA